MGGRLTSPSSIRRGNRPNDCAHVTDTWFKRPCLRVFFVFIHSPLPPTTMSDADDVQYSLLSTTRYDDDLRNVAWNTRVNGGKPSSYMLLPYHFDRLMTAARDHGWIATKQRTDYADLVAACDDAVNAARPQHDSAHLRVSLEPLISSSYSQFCSFAFSCHQKVHLQSLQRL